MCEWQAALDAHHGHTDGCVAGAGLFAIAHPDVGKRYLATLGAGFADGVLNWTVSATSLPSLGSLA
jgi:hypothetical protein